MSKKKINKNLDRLFENINKETEMPVEAEKRAGKLPVRQIAPSEEVTIESPEPFSESDLSMLEDRTQVQEQVVITPSAMLSTAFRTEENSWATLKVVDDSQERKWGTEEQMLVRQVADQLSLALENARLFQEAQRRAREMTALAEVGRDISATLELQKILDRIAAQAMETLNTVTSAVYIPDAEFKTLIAITVLGTEADEIKSDPITIGEGILGNIALNKKGQIANDASNNPLAITIQGTQDSPDEHLMATPILSQEKLNGLLAVWRVGSGQGFTQQEFEFLESLAQQAAIAVENARLFEETRRRTEELAVLNEMARELSAQMNATGIAETAYRYAGRLLNTFNFYIALFDERRNQISFPILIEKNKKIDTAPRKPGNGLTEYILKSKAPLFIPDNFPKYAKKLGLGQILVGDNEPAVCWLGVPLLIGNSVIGVMTVQSLSTPNLYNERDKDMLSTIASQVSIAFENARLFRDSQSRARREKILREITAHIRATNDPEMIAKTAVRELGQALGVSTFIQVSGSDSLNKSKSKEAESKSVKKKPTKARKKSIKGGA